MKLLHLFKSQSFRNIKWNLVTSVVYPVAMFLATPVFLNRLGEEQFGVWVLVNTVLQLMGSFNFGLGDANIKFISESAALQNQKEIDRTVSFSLGFSLLISLSIGMLTLIGTVAMEYFSIFQINSNYEVQTYSSLRIISLLFIFRFIEVILLSVFQGFGRYDLSSVFTVISRLVALGINVIFLIQGAGLLMVLVGSLFTQIAFIVIEFLFVKKIYAFLSMKPKISFLSMRKFLGFGFWTWLQTLLAIITTQVDKLVVAFVSGLEMLSYYSIGAMLMMQFHTVFISISNWVFPVVAAKATKKESLNNFYDNTQTLLFLFGVISLSLFLSLENFIVTKWLGEEAYSKVIPFLKIFIYYNLFLVMNIIPYFFLNGAGYAKANAFSEFLLKVGNIAGMTICFFLWGNEGLIWGLVISTALVLPLKTVQINRYVLNAPNRWYGFDSVLCSGFLVAFFQIEEIYTRIICCVLFLVTFYFVYLRRSILMTLFRMPFSKIKDSLIN